MLATLLLSAIVDRAPSTYYGSPGCSNNYAERPASDTCSYIWSQRTSSTAHQDAIWRQTMRKAENFNNPACSKFVKVAFATGLFLPLDLALLIPTLCTLCLLTQPISTRL